MLLVHHAEIALKGKNRGMFENCLARNLEEAFRREQVNVTVRREEGRIVIEGGDEHASTPQFVMGVKNYAKAHAVEKSEHAIKEKAAELLRELDAPVRFETKRADKSFQPNSQQLNEQLGEIARQQGKKVDYTHGTPLHTEITSKHVYLYTSKHEGPGGLPVGSAGKVLCLLSGGIDSPVAAWQMMRRGCKVDFVHFHAYTTKDSVMQTKMGSILNTLEKYQAGGTAHLVPYMQYEVYTQGKADPHLDLVVFRNYMLRVAERIALRSGCEGIVTGDNLAQVASQTLENMRAALQDIHMPVYRPLLAYDKDQITRLAREITTYELSVQPYKDCCSIIARKPATKASVKAVREQLQRINIEELTKYTLDEVEEVPL